VETDNRVLSRFRIVTAGFALFWLAAVTVLIWALVTTRDPMWLMFGSAALVGLAGAATIVQAVRRASAGVGAARLAERAKAILLLGMPVPVGVAAFLTATGDGGMSHVLLGVMASLLLYMSSLIVDTCHRVVRSATT